MGLNIWLKKQNILFLKNNKAVLVPKKCKCNIKVTKALKSEL